jgi:hypothetical protein
MLHLDLFEELLEAARASGYRVRSEWLSGQGGGACRVRGEKQLFVDLSLPLEDRLEVLLHDLAEDSRMHAQKLSPELRRFLEAPHLFPER